MPLSVRNNEPNTTVFTATVGGDPLRLTWGTKGEHNDTIRVPDTLADNVEFLNALDQGVFEVVDGPQEILDRLSKETAKAAERRKASLDAARAKSQAEMDRRQDKDLIGHTCIGPGSQGRTAKCQKPVLIRNTQIDEIPPLCEQHQHLAPLFSLTQTGSKGEGATETREGVVRREWRQAILPDRTTVGA